MPQEKRIYFCIDMKSFYASVECAERNLNPFETNLVVADPNRGSNALCLAVTPGMKALGIRNRCRLSEIPGNVPYITALPRMQLYIDYAADIYGIYLNYFAPEDIYVYSIDESFIDATGYLKASRLQPEELARMLMNEISEKLKIPSTAGIGTNLYLAKIALDITAKHTADHMGYLDEELFRETLWDHEPLTDFWGIGGGTVRRLERAGIHTQREIAEAPPETLYWLFGKDAELLIDHSRGRESCLMSDIKNYRAKSHSVSFSQILPRDYSRKEARYVMAEMILHGCQELIRRKAVTKKIWISIGYTRDILPAAKGTTRIFRATNVNSAIQPPVLELFDRLADRSVPIRRLAISFAEVTDESSEVYDLFTDRAAVEREKARERAVLDLADKYGKNMILRGLNYQEGTTQKERNEMIGGHRAGYDG